MLKFLRLALLLLILEAGTLSAAPPKLSDQVRIQMSELADTSVFNNLLANYSNEFRGRSVLFRGRQAVKYGFVANGSNYWVNDGFRRGAMKYNGKLYNNVLLNVDAYAGNLEVKIADTDISLVLERKMIEGFIMGRSHFVTLSGNNPYLPEGYYEVLYCGDAIILKRVVKLLYNSVENMNEEGIGYFDPNYRHGLATFFKYEPYYYYVKGDFVKSLKKGSKLLSLYPKRRKAVKNYIYQKYNYITPDMDTYLVEALTFIESEK